MHHALLKPQRHYIFKDYFNFSNPPDEIAAEFGYDFALEVLQLPSVPAPLEVTQRLEATYYRVLPKVPLTSETARREVFIAPLLLEIVQLLEAKLNIEYPLNVAANLNGILDYLLRTETALLVVEAKKGDLDRGFNQLTAELIALDKYETDNPLEMLYGAVTVGNIWNFGVLHRPPKKLVRDIHNYRLPQDTEKLFSILLGILQPQLAA